MKLRNNGFAISLVLYGLLVLFLILVVAMLGILSSYKSRMNKLIDEGNNGARENVKNQIEIDNMVVIKIDDNTFKKCKESSIKDSIVYKEPLIMSDGLSYDDLAKNSFMNSLLINDCKTSDECFFSSNEVNCVDGGSTYYKCDAKIYNNCIDSELVEGYKDLKIYSNEENTNNS